MASSDEGVISHAHLMAVEGFMAEITKSQAQYVANQSQYMVNQNKQLEVMSELSKSVNELVVSERVRVETDKQTVKQVQKLVEFKDYATPIVNKAKDDQAFWSGFIKYTVYAVSAAMVIAVLSFSGKLVYDNAGKSNQPQQQQKAGK